MSELILPPDSSSNKQAYTLFPSNAEIKKSALGAPNIRTSSTRKYYTFRDQRFWAENGRICIEDGNNGDFTSCSIDEFGLRALALARQARKMIGLQLWADEIKELTAAVGDMSHCIMEAKEQGDPHCEEVLLWKLRQRGHKVSLGGFKPHAVKEGPISGIKVGKGNGMGRIHID